jgi:excisionase family DNA binding protein
MIDSSPIPAIPASTPPLKLLYTPVEAAHALGISRSSLYGLLGRGELRSVRLGGDASAAAEALTAFVDTLDDRSTVTGHR